MWLLISLKSRGPKALDLIDFCLKKVIVKNKKKKITFGPSIHLNDDF